MKPRRFRLRRERARPALAAAAFAWENLFASFTDAIVVTDRDTRIVLVNPAAEELIGLPRTRVVGQRCADIFQHTPIISEMVRRVQASATSEAQSEAQLLQRSRSVPVRLACLPVWDARDRIGGTAIVIHDLTYSLTLEEAARRNESLARLGTLVAGLAHEIKNPLAGIKGAAQLLGQRLTDRTDLQNYTSVISREVDRLSALVQDLLTLGAPPKPKLKRLNIHAVIQHVLAVTEGELTAHGVQLRLRFDPSLPDILGDHAQLSQLFLNLIKNANEAMTGASLPQGSTPSITITTRMETDFHILREQKRSDKFLRVDVADQGPGIDATDQTRVFEPFFTTKPRGTGLGLAISHRIVAEHSGIIRTEPNRPTGTVVSVTLPVCVS
jgi:two-component system nitrogen regulation sensor histidine kinase GlnL